MTSIANTPQLPRLPRRALSAALWFAAGGLLGGSVATIADVDGASNRTEPAALTGTADPVGNASVSAQAAERWALSELQQRHLDCAAIHHSPDAIERCARG